MKLCTFQTADGELHFGAARENDVIDLHKENSALPSDCLTFIRNYEQLSSLAFACIETPKSVWPLNDIVFKPPLLPPSFRDFMGFAEHHETCRASRGEKVDAVYYKIPVFYFSNTLAMAGSGEAVSKPAGTEKMDFEFEVGIVIGRQGRDIQPEKAIEHIFGYFILNDWSARDIQMQECKVGLGPAKGKDFATTVGPYLVTKDEFDPFLTGKGLRYNRATRLKLNGKLLRENNLSSIYHDFAAMIARASQNVTLYPGELLGSGTIGGGCLLEYGGKIPFLTSGDQIEMEVEGLGVLVCPVK